jgi:hypothetical protein
VIQSGSSSLSTRCGGRPCQRAAECWSFKRIGEKLKVTKKQIEKLSMYVRSISKFKRLLKKEPVGREEEEDNENQHMRKLVDLYKLKKKSKHSCPESNLFTQKIVL